MYKFKKILFFLVLISGFSALAENKAEGHDQKGAVEEGVAQQPVYSGKQTEEWQEYQAELDQLKIKLEAQRSIVEELFVRKKGNESQFTREETEQLNKHDQELTRLQKEYDLKLSTFKTKFPEKGQSVGRKYNRKNQQQSSAGEESQVQKLNKKIEEQYGSGKKKTDPPKDNKSKTKALPPKMNDGVSDKIILVK